MISEFTIDGRDFTRSTIAENGVVRFNAEDGSSVIISKKDVEGMIDVSINTTLVVPSSDPAVQPDKARSYLGVKVRRQNPNYENDLASFLAICLGSASALVPGLTHVSSRAAMSARADLVDFARLIARL